MKVAYFDCARGVSAELLLGALAAAQDGPRVVASPESYKLPGGVRLRCVHAAVGESIGRRVELDFPASMSEDLELSEADFIEFMRSAVPDGAAYELFDRVLTVLNLAMEESRPSARRNFAPTHRGITLRMAAVLAVLMRKLAALGLDAIYYSPVNAGGETAEVRHVPDQIVLRLAEDSGMRIFLTPGAGELLTLDGAAVLAALGKCASPQLVPTASGRGFDADGAELGVVIGEEMPPMAEPKFCTQEELDELARDCEKAEPESTKAVPAEAAPADISVAADASVQQPGGVSEAAVIECSIDSMTPVQLAEVCGRLIKAGALDVWQTPIIARGGVMTSQLSVLCGPEQVGCIADAVLSETAAAEVRVTSCVRRVRV